MLYRESGDFSTTYQQDGQTFPIKFDRYRYYAVMAIAFCVVPFLVNDYWVNAIFLPFLIYSIAAIGLNTHGNHLSTQFPKRLWCRAVGSPIGTIDHNLEARERDPWRQR